MGRSSSLLNKIRLFQFALLIGGAVLILGGDQLRRSDLQYPGIALIGLSTVTYGLQALLSRQISFRDEHRIMMSYRGLAAASWGLMLMLAGLAVIGGAVAAVLGIEQALFEMLRARPGLIVAPLGVIFVLRSVAAMVGPDHPRRGLWGKVRRLFGFLLGLIGLVLGAATIALGSWDLYNPGVLQQVLESISVWFLALLSQVG